MEEYAATLPLPKAPVGAPRKDDATAASVARRKRRHNAAAAKDAFDAATSAVSGSGIAVAEVRFGPDVVRIPLPWWSPRRHLSYRHAYVLNDGPPAAGNHVLYDAI